MFRFVSSVARHAACAGIVAASLVATAAMAQTAPATGLGQAWPNAVDQSANPNWHVYVFERDGVRYVQVNDRNGNVRAAIGRAGDTLFALPVGMDAQHVDVASTSNSATSAQMVYQDDSTTVTAEPQRDGSEQIVAHISTCESGFCSGGSVYLSYQ